MSEQDRRRLLGDLRARFDRFAIDNDVDAVMSDAALAQITGVLDAMNSPATDLELSAAAGRLYWCRFLVAQRRNDLDAALSLLALTHQEQPDTLPDEVRQAMVARAMELLEVALATSAPGSLDWPIYLLRIALRAAPADSQGLHMHRQNLGVALQTRHEQGGGSADNDEAITLFRQSIEAFERDALGPAMALSNLGAALLTRFKRTRAQADLDEALVALGRSVDGAESGGDQDLAKYLSNLGKALETRFDHGGTPSDLDDAIAALRRAVAAANDADRAAHLSHLGILLQARIKRTGLDADRDEAIDIFRKALAATPTPHAERAGRLSNLAGSLEVRFDRMGDPADLEEAIATIRQAVANADDPSDCARYLSNLGHALRERFEYTGLQADLDDAVEACRQAVDATPTEHPNLPDRLTSLGNALHQRFKHSGSTADIDAAIELHRRALAATPSAHADLALRLSNLAGALKSRFDRGKELTDLIEAVDTIGRAVAAVPAGSPELAGYLSNLGVALVARFSQTNAAADLDQAVETGREALAATPPDHHDLGDRLSNLGTFLYQRFAHGRTAADINEAIDLLRQAADTKDTAHPKRSSYLAILGHALEARFESGGVPGDRDEAVNVFRDATAVETAPPIIRANAARGWGRAAAGAEDWRDAIDGYSTAVELIALVAPRSLERSDQEHLLTGLTGVGSEAAACCLQVGDVERAVELWEQGRGVLLAQALDARSDITALAERNPGLAERFARLRDMLDATPDVTVHAGRQTSPLATAHSDAQARAEAERREIDRRRELAAEFEQVIAEIRRLPEFHRFLLPPRAQELVSAAESGPVILINVSDIRSDALVLTGGRTEAVRLPGLTPQALHDQVAEFLAALDDTHNPDAGHDVWNRAEKRLAAILSWLHDTAAGPVLDRLEFTASESGQPLPRVWWCPSGLLSLLPLHAAGHHDSWSDGDPATVIDRVVSSYTPTVRALTYARRKQATQAPPAEPSAGRVVAVAMPHTPDASDLPGTADEAALLEGLFGEQATVLEEGNATRESVETALPQYPWAHFACHASNDPSDSSAGHLLLHDHQRQALTILDIARLRHDARLAFLSACSTARTGLNLPDEAIHLSSAFQLAGYRHVIGTLWPIGDRPAVLIAEKFYTAIANDETADGAALALHDATRALRARVLDSPSAWAAHVHVGA